MQGAPSGVGTLDPRDSWDALSRQGLQGTVQALMVFLDRQKVLTALTSDPLGRGHLGASLHRR